MIRSLLIGGETVSAEAPDLEARLAGAHRRKERPSCLCRDSGVPMYVARIGPRYFLKRMPLTGPQHDPACDSYEPPPELSGRGEVAGSAIDESADDGVTRLKLDFSLSRTGKRSAAPASAEAGESARSDGTKLTLRGLLHFLWEEAELNHWTPRMTGKRNWGLVRHRLIEAAANKAAKGAALTDQLFIPEPFSSDRKAELAERRRLALSPIAAGSSGARRLMVLIGEVKEIGPARFGHKLVIRHLPDFPFMLAYDVHKRITNRFGSELELWDGVEGAHLVAIATFGVSATGLASTEEIALMVTSDQWIPLEHAYDATLIEALARSGARFVKGLRYNLPRTRPLASAVLPTTQPRPTALYVVPPGVDETYRGALDALVASSELAPWVWEAGEALPPLPFRNRA